MDKNGIDENIAEILNIQEYSVWKVSGLWKSRVQYKWMKKVGGGGRVFMEGNRIDGKVAEYKDTS